jgi:DGQHR domain-containing protein
MKKKATRSTKKPYRYYAMTYRQRGSHGPRFLVFHAPASEIKKWADVDRMSPGNPSGAQRPLREMKARKVARFFEAENDNTIPTAIVVAIDKSAITFVGKKDPTSGNGEHGVLAIAASAAKPGLIIDGQHRVYALLRRPRICGLTSWRS